MIFMFINQDENIYIYIYIYIYKKQICEWIIAKNMERIKDIYIMQLIFLICQRLQ